MIRPRSCKLYRGFNLTYNWRKNQVISNKNDNRFMADRNISLSNLKRLRDWLNNTIKYMEMQNAKNEKNRLG